MSVRRMERRDPKTGTTREFWMVDVVFEHPDGREERIRKVSPVQTRRAAEQYERELRDALLTGRHNQEEVVPAPKLAEFAKDFLTVYATVNNKPSERKAKEIILRKHLVPSFGEMRLDEIDAQAIERFKARQNKTGLSNKTVNNQLTVLGTLLQTAVEWKHINAVPPMRRLPVQRPKFDFLTFEEADRLVQAAAKEPAWNAMIVVALHTGLRLGELLALQWDDCDLVTGTMVVRRSNWQGHIGPPKSGKDRTLPLNTLAVGALKRHRHLKGMWVWCNNEGNFLNKDDLRLALRRIRKRAGLRHFDWHVLRHSFASHLAMRGVPLKAVQELMGHASIEMTMRYAHLSPDVRKDAVNVLLRGYGNLTATRPPKAKTAT
jgi:integrase